MPDGRCALYGGQAEDRKTGLVWQRCRVGQELRSGLGCTGLVQPLTYAEALAVQRGGWRLPTVDELTSLLDESRRKAGAAPYIDEAVFPVTLPTYIELLTSQPYGPADAWCVSISFSIGVADNCARNDRHAVRLVRQAG